MNYPALSPDLLFFNSRPYFYKDGHCCFSEDYQLLRHGKLIEKINNRSSFQDWIEGKSEIALDPRIRAYVTAPQPPIEDKEAWRTYVPDGRTVELDWVIFDVESKEAHGSVEANIATAQALYRAFHGKGLTEGLTVICSGSGFRFAWPKLIPEDYRDKFLTVLDWDYLHTLLPGLDVGVNTAGRNKFFRIAGVNGEKHTAFLDNPHDLLNLSSERYRELVTAPLTLGTAQEWAERIPSILPDGSFIGEEWQAFLDECDVTAWIQSHPKKKRVKATTPDEEEEVSPAILEALDEEGIAVGDEVEKWEGVWAHPLSKCPLCGFSDGSPILFKSGLVFCLKANKCDGQGKPFGPGRWIDDWDDRRELTPEELIEACGGRILTPRLLTTIEEARRDNEAELAAGGDVCFRSTPGVGKTRLDAKYAYDNYRNENIIYVAPTHKILDSFKLELCKEAEARYNALDETTRNWFSKSPQYAEVITYKPLLETDCPYREEITERAEKLRGIARQMACDDCSRYFCEYRAQFADILKNRGKIIVMCTSAFFLTHRALGDIKTILADENCAKLLSERVEVSPDDMRNFIVRLAGSITPEALGEWSKGRYTEEDIDLCAAMRGVDKLKTRADLLGRDWGLFTQAEIARETPFKSVPPKRVWATNPPEGVSDHDRRYNLFDLAGLTPEEAGALGTLGDALAYCLLEKRDNRAARDALFRSGVAYSMDPIRFLQIAFTPGDNKWAYLKVAHDAPPVFVGNERKTNIVPGARLIIADGTARQEELDLIRPGIKIITKHVPSQATHIRLDAKTSKTDIERLGGLKYLKELLNHAMQRVSESDKVLLCTHMKYETAIMEFAKANFCCNRFESIHFKAGTGTNDFEDFDACIMLGDYHDSREGNFDYLHTLSGDPRKQDKLHRAFGMGEMVQCAHRIRPINLTPDGRRKKVIVVASRWLDDPAFGKPEVVKTDNGGRYDMEGSREVRDRLETVAEALGFLDKRVAYAAGVHVDGCNGTSGLSGEALSRIRGLIPRHNEVLILSSKKWGRLIDSVHEVTGLPYAKLKGKTKGTLVLGEYGAAKRYIPGLLEGHWTKENKQGKAA